MNDSFKLDEKVSGEGMFLLLIPDGLTGWKCYDPSDLNVIEVLPGMHLM